MTPGGFSRILRAFGESALSCRLPASRTLCLQGSRQTRIEAPPLIIKPLWARLTVAVLLPVVLATLALAPIFTSHLAERVDSSRQSAESLLASEYDLLLRGMDESFNKVLATAELPLLRRFLSRQSIADTPAWGLAAQSDWSRLTSTLPHALEESPGEALLVD